MRAADPAMQLTSLSSADDKPVTARAGCTHTTAQGRATTALHNSVSRHLKAKAAAAALAAGAAAHAHRGRKGQSVCAQKPTYKTDTPT